MDEAIPRYDMKAQGANDVAPGGASVAEMPPPYTLRHNVRFVKLWEERRADVVALRDIAAGEELFVSYGSNYWKVHGPLRGE